MKMFSSYFPEKLTRQSKAQGIGKVFDIRLYLVDHFYWEIRQSGRVAAV